MFFYQKINRRFLFKKEEKIENQKSKINTEVTDQELENACNNFQSSRNSRSGAGAQTVYYNKNHVTPVSSNSNSNNRSLSQPLKRYRDN